MRDSLISAIEKQLRQDQDELAEAQKATETIFPIIEKLTRSEITNPVSLKARVAKMSPKYRDAFYGLCRIATSGGPEGSYIVLDPEKVFAIVSELEGYEESTKSSTKKSIFGISKKIIKGIKELAESKLAALCHLVNDIIVKKVINVPPTDHLKAGVMMKISKLVKKVKSKKSSGRS